MGIGRVPTDGRAAAVGASQWQWQWRLVRQGLNHHRVELARAAASLYPDAGWVGNDAVADQAGLAPDCGFVGRVVVDQLARVGHQVTALPRRAEMSFPEGTTVVTADPLDRDRLFAIVLDGAFDEICHLAGLTRVRKSFADLSATSR